MSTDPRAAALPTLLSPAKVERRYDMLLFCADRPVSLGPDFVITGFEIDAAARSADPFPIATAIENTRFGLVVVDVLPSLTLRLLEGLRCGERLKHGKEK
jgi:hypothetical protein